MATPSYKRGREMHKGEIVIKKLQFLPHLSYQRYRIIYLKFSKIVTNPVLDIVAKLAHVLINIL